MDRRHAEVAQEWFINMSKIKKEVCNFFAISQDMLEGKSKSKTLVRARIVFAQRAQKEAQASLREIGEFLGKRPSSTIVYYLKRFEKKNMVKNIVF